MTQVLLGAAGVMFLTIGTLHGVLTLRDVRNPRAFTPTDPAVRVAMQNARLALNPRANIWDAWLGFNLSHSVGVVLVGAVLIVIAAEYFPAFAASVALRTAAVVVAAVYLLLSLRFWFWGPALGSAIALLCILAAAIL